MSTRRSASGSNLTFGTAIGYNDAEFKETGVRWAAATRVALVSDGDRIPGAPWTATLNGQYDFKVMLRDAFVRFDYEYRSQGPDNTAALNSANRSPVLPPLDPEVARPRAVDEHVVASCRCADRCGECLALRAQRAERRSNHHAR